MICLKIAENYLSRGFCFSLKSRVSSMLVLIMSHLFHIESKGITVSLLPEQQEKKIVTMLPQIIYMLQKDF